MMGKRVHVVIEEDGTETPPTLPPATLVKQLVSPDGGVSHLIRLDRAVTCRHAAAGEDWTLSELVVWPKFPGTSLESELALHPPGTRIPVRIANVIARIRDTAEYLDPAKLVYFAVGWIGEV